jgi:hypothetical protein
MSFSKITTSQVWFFLGALLLGMTLIVLMAAFQKRITATIKTDQHAKACIVEARNKATKLHFKFSDREITELCEPEIKAANAALAGMDVQ